MDDAKALIIGVRQALRNSTKHHRKREILQALFDENRVILKPNRRHRNVCM